MARRGHREGSIYQRKDGRWTAAITLENRKRKTFYGKTRKEVQEQLTKALHEQQQGTLATGPQHENHPLTPEQARKLLEAAKSHRLEALLTVALATGMRKGELLSLQWANVDFEKMSLQVKRTFLGKHEGENRENEPKSASGRRSLPLAQFAVDALKQHRIHQLEARLQVGDAWIDRNLVFCKYNGDFFALTTFRAWFKALLKEAGLPDIRFHDLRHSAATILLSMGVDLKVIQQILGHSNYAITANVYTDVLPSMSREAMQKMDDAFRKQSR